MKTVFRNTVSLKERKDTQTKRVHAYTQSIFKMRTTPEYTAPESSLCIAGDELYQESIVKALKPFKNVKQVVLIGIGGSSLGTEAVYHALKTRTSPKLVVLDQIESDSFHLFESILAAHTNVEDIAIVIVSKSGATTETVLNAAVVLEMGEKKFGATFTSRVICVGNEGTHFFEQARQKHAICIPMPEIIGGRYSLFTAVGMVPLILLRIDTKSLRKGACALFEKSELRAVESHAVTLALLAEQGAHTVNFFTFNERLEQCGYWYRQLLAESIGKRTTKHGVPFTHQLLPIVTTSADLHSMAQLYLSGYQNLYTCFFDYNQESTFRIRTAPWPLASLPFLKGKYAHEVKQAIKQGVLKAYNDQKLPYRYSELSSCSAFEVGLLLSSLMCEVMCLAHLFEIDAFDQPSVELYKKHTRAILDS